MPFSQNAQLRVFNAENCPYNFTTNIKGLESFQVNALDMNVDKFVDVPGTFDLVYGIIRLDDNCPEYAGGTKKLTDKTAWSLFLNSQNLTGSTFWEEDFVNKPSDSYPLVRVLGNIQQQRSVVWKGSSEQYTFHANETRLVRVSSGEYAVSIDNQEVSSVRVRTGGVYTLFVNEQTSGGYETRLIEVTEPNSMNILWLIPQYVVMTLGEVMFSVTGLEFSYAQSPPSMKSVLQACWLLTVAFGNVIVVIIAEAALFDSQASEFFLFAGLMFVDMLVFMFMAYNYQPNDPNKVEEAEPLTNGDSREIKALETGIDNKGQETDD